MRDDTRSQIGLVTGLSIQKPTSGHLKSSHKGTAALEELEAKKDGGAVV